MRDNGAVGWLFSGTVAVGALVIFWDGLVPHASHRPKFQPPVAHPEPVEMKMVPPMELPPPLPRKVEAAPVLPVLPPPKPAQGRK